MPSGRTKTTAGAPRLRKRVRLLYRLYGQYENGSLAGEFHFAPHRSNGVILSCSLANPLRELNTLILLVVVFSFYYLILHATGIGPAPATKLNALRERRACSVALNTQRCSIST